MFSGEFRMFAGDFQGGWTHRLSLPIAYLISLDFFSLTCLKIPSPPAGPRYASLFFVACIDQDDNELITLEKIHLFVEVLDRYFGNVCELDIIFNFHKAYYILDELFIGGELQVPVKSADCNASRYDGL